MAGESAFKNAVKRITHKERAQPSKRKKLGLLEKHEDYKIRAKDYSNKKSFITSLKRKASHKNNDEFYFGMHNAQVRGGIHVTEPKTMALTDATVSILKTQDLGYAVIKKVSASNL